MMKILALAVLTGVVSGGLLGGKQCTWGPDYWCESFQNANECGATEHCQKNVWSKLTKTKQSAVDGSDACTFCKDMVSDVKNILSSNQTEATVLQYLNKACDYLPDDYSTQECKKIEQHYVDQFEKCVQDNIDPDTICKLCRLCNDAKSSKKPAVLTAAKSVVPAKISHLSLKSSALRLRTSDAPLCAACKSFVDLAEKEISNPGVQDAITAMLKADCSKMSGTEALECEAAVSLAMPSVFKFVIGELTDKLCVSAGLCTSGSLTAGQAATAVRQRLMAAIHSDAVRDTIHKATAVRRRQSDSSICNDCEMVAGYAKIILSNNATEQEIQQLLSTDVCPQLGEFSDMCKTLVEEYVPQLYAVLLKYVDPATICKDLKLCNSVSKSRLPASVPAASSQVDKKERVGASLQCVLCEFVMTELENAISKNSTQAAIVQAVEQVCSILPSSISAECKSLVDEYGTAIIKLIVSDVAPGEVCGLLRLCTSSVKSAPLCSVCEMVIGYVDSVLQKNSTKEEIVETVEKVCSLLPGEFSNQCDSLVQQYGAEIIDLLVNGYSPKEVCSVLGLCEKSGKTVKADGLVHLYNRAGNI